MGADEATIAIGAGYTRVLLGTNGVILLLFLNNAIFRGAGDAALAMRSLWLANGINIALDPCLIFGLGPFPELGVTGAAVATTIGRGAGVLYQFWMLRRASGRVSLRGLALDPPLLARLVRLSLWGIAQLLIATSSWLVLMRLVAPFGAEAVAGYTIAIRIIVFALLPAWGLSNAAATLVGQNLGARQPERAERRRVADRRYNMVFLLAVMVVFLLGDPRSCGSSPPTPRSSPSAAQALRIISYGYVLLRLGHGPDAGLQRRRRHDHADLGQPGLLLAAARSRSPGGSRARWISGRAASSGR